jgi:hypothetical protein
LSFVVFSWFFAPKTLNANRILLSLTKSPCAMAASPAFWDVAYGPGGSSGPENSRFLRLHPAPGEQHGTQGTVVVLHGGYWKNKFGLDDVAWKI